MRQKCEKMRKSGPRPPQKMSNKVIPDPRISPNCVQEASKLRPRGPRGDQQAPKASQERSKSGQERPQTTQERPKSRQERPESDRNLPGGRPMCQQRYVFYAFLRFPMFCGVFLFFGAFASFFCVLDGFSMLGCSCFCKFASSCHATQDFGGSFQS